jgi:putative addiction module component (TIGR02574 family)
VVENFEVDFEGKLRMVRTMSTATLTQSLFLLPVAERVALADRLYASVPEDWQKTVDQAWLEEATRRSEEMDADPSLELSHEDFMAGLKINRDRR